MYIYTYLARQPWYASLLKLIMNWWPPFWGAGIRVKSISADFRQAEVILKSKRFNRNYVGTHFGGSIFAMTDPFHMLMTLKNLGKGYIVWDKAAHIEFKKPGRGLLKVKFEYTESEIQQIKHQADTLDKYIFDRTVDVVDESGDVVASVIKTIYVKRK